LGILSIYLLISTIITPFGTAFGSLVTALGKPAIAFRIVLINTVINISASYYLMKEIGLWGAPVALAATEVIGFVIVAKISNQLAGIKITAILTRIVNLYLKNFLQLVTYYRNLKSKLIYAK